MTTSKVTTKDRQYVPYGKLRHSPRNVRSERTTPAYKQGIGSLANSIEAFGVINNLAVTEHRHGKHTHYEVEGGGRRLDALDLLHERGVITRNYPVPIKIIPLDAAVAVSLSENVDREQLHKADEVVAFRTLIEGGKSIEEIATHFNVTPLVVERRLKLAKVAPKFLAMFRADDITVDILMALALTDDHERQIQVWDAMPAYSRTATSLRRALTQEQVHIKHDPVARFVGVKAYEQAGGVIVRDLFSEEDDGYMLDAALLHRLAQDKLETRRATVAKDGFAWVEAHIHLDYAERNVYGRVGTIAREPTKKEAKKVAKLRDAIAAQRVSEDEGEGEEKFEALQDLENELAQIEETLRVPDPVQQALAGAIVTIGDNGKIEVLTGLIRPEDKRTAKAAAKKAKPVSGSDEKEVNELSARLTLRLTAQLTAGLQLATARSPQAALALTVYTLAKNGHPLHLHLTRSNLRMHDETIQDSPAAKELRSLRERVLDQVPGSLAWCLEQSTERLLEILAACVAEGVDAISNTAKMSDDIAALARATKLDMADWWEPKAETYLRFVPKPLIVASVTECLTPEAGAELAKAPTKALMVSKAETMLAGKRWLPEPMRS